MTRKGTHSSLGWLSGALKEGNGWGAGGGNDWQVLWVRHWCAGTIVGRAFRARLSTRITANLIYLRISGAIGPSYA